MSERRPRSLGAFVSTAGAIVLVIAGVLIGIFNEQSFQLRRAQSLSAQAKVLAATVQPALVFMDSAAAQDLVSAMQADPEVESAAVYDADGQRIARFSRGPEQPPARLTATGARWDGGALAVAAPVSHETSRIGVVYVRSTREPIRAFAQRHAGATLLLLTAMFLVAAAQAAQSTQARAARESQARAAELAGLNQQLQQQIERRETAEEALRQAQKMETLGQLTGGIAHDFNNLLQTVQGGLDLIARNPADQKRVERWAAMGLEAAERGSRLTSQLLAFSRAQKLEMRLVDVRQVVLRLQELLPNTLGPGVTVSFHIADGDAFVVADATQLELALLNLCINSRDAMPNGGEIQVAAEPRRIEHDPELRPGAYLQLSVADNGVGMPEDVRARAFDPFFTTKGVGKGTGLGLAQVYGIAKQAGGVARIDSGAGRGAKVTILLPLAAGDAAAPRDRQPHAVPSATPGARILIVDDDEGVRAYVCEALTSLGYDCLQAPDGAVGLNVLGREQVDLMIVDYAMPGMTGAEMATAALAERPDLPVVFASGYAESSALEAALGRPARLLRKPFDSELLARRVAEALAGEA